MFRYIKIYISKIIQSDTSSQERPQGLLGEININDLLILMSNEIIGFDEYLSYSKKRTLRRGDLRGILSKK